MFNRISPERAPAMTPASADTRRAQGSLPSIPLPPTVPQAPRQERPYHRIFFSHTPRRAYRARIIKAGKEAHPGRTRPGASLFPPRSPGYAKQHAIAKEDHP